MTKHLRKLTRLLFMVFIFGILAFRADGDATITIRNNSDYDIDHIYFSPPGKAKWDGSDILGKHEVLAPGEEVEVKVPCGTWDVKIVMEDGGECFSYGELICGGEELWEIDNLDCTDEE